MNKRIFAHDTGRTIRGTRVVIKSAKTGKVLDEGSNSILYAGSINAALKDFGYYENLTDGVPNNAFIQPDDIAIPMSYDVAIYGESTTEYSAEGPVCLFAVGVDGVELSTQSSQKKAVQYEGWIDPSAMIPFRMVGKSTGALSAEQKALYAQPYVSGDMEYYYFKRFDQTPIMVTQYEVNGMPISSPPNAALSPSKSNAADYYNNYLISNQYSSGAQVIVEMTCRVTKEECREWFEYGTVANAQMNPNVSSIMICTAIPVRNDAGEIVSYKNIMPKSKRNITRELLLDEEKGLEIIYQYLY